MNRMNGSNNGKKLVNVNGERNRNRSRKKDEVVTPKRNPKSGHISDWAKDLIARLGHVICKNEKWWRWNRQIWEPIEPKGLPSRVTYNMLPKVAQSARFARMILDSANMMCQRTDKEIVFNGAVWIDQDGAALVNLANCTLRIASNNDNCIEQLDHDINNYSTACLPVEFDQSAKCPVFDYLLGSALPEAEDRELLQCFAGYCLLGDHRFQSILLCFGPPNSGKSLLIYHGLGSIFGKLLMTHVSLEKICSGGDELRDLEKSLVNLGTEINQRQLKESDMFNKVVCGEATNVSLKYDQSRRVEVLCKFIQLCNHLPKWDRGSEAQARRIRILYFGEDFSTHPKDGSLEAKVKLESAGIFNWALEGLCKVMSMGQLPLGSSQSQKCNDMFRKHNNPIGAFMNSSVEFCSKNDNYIKAEDLALVFKEWCKEEDIQTRMDNPAIARCLNANYSNRLRSGRKYLDGKQIRIVEGIRWNPQGRELLAKCQKLSKWKIR
jgi:P4 family phage/plasmid primase-like protien